MSASVTSAVATRPVAVPRIGLFTTGHFTNDLYGNMMPVLMPVIAAQLGFSLSAAALLFTIYSFTSSIVQPYLGHLADRSGAVSIAPIGVVLSALGGALVAVAPNYATLVVLAVVGGIGVAAYHPQAAAMVVSFAGPYRAMVMSIYLLGGSIGFAIGPLLITGVADYAGLNMTPILLVPGIVVAALLYWFAPRDWNPRSGQSLSLWQVIRDNRRVLGLLVLIVAIRSVAQTGLTFFLPFYFAREGLASGEYARIVAAFLFTGAFGGIIGAYIADRWLGRTRVMVAELFISSLFMLLMLFSSGILIWVWTALAGITLLGSWSLLTVRGQELMPANVGMASGIMLGLSIGLGGLTVSPLGFLAEAVGVPPVLVGLAALPPLAGLLALKLPRRPGVGRVS
ncbi:MAG TPA: MFS transporter [Dehalococcoidia bacterium]|nr:MFS transporter [Dehalococcoidia bacterium]